MDAAREEVHLMAVLSANCIICERALKEADNVLSAIRIVDLFYTAISTEIPVEQQAVPMTIIANVRFTSDDTANHTAELNIVRPDGEEKRVTILSDAPVPPGAPFEEFPKLLVIFAQLGVSPKQFGLHQVVVVLDGAEVARTQFTLVERQPTTPLPNSSAEEQSSHPRIQ